MIRKLWIFLCKRFGSESSIWGNEDGEDSYDECLEDLGDEEDEDNIYVIINKRSN